MSRVNHCQVISSWNTKFFSILLKHVSDHWSVLFQFAWLYFKSNILKHEINRVKRYHAITCESLFSLAYYWKFVYSGKHTRIIVLSLRKNIFHIATSFILVIIQNQNIVGVNQHRIFIMPYQELRDK